MKQIVHLGGYFGESRANLTGVFFLQPFRQKKWEVQRND